MFVQQILSACMLRAYWELETPGQKLHQDDNAKS